MFFRTAVVTPAKPVDPIVTWKETPGTSKKKLAIKKTKNAEKELTALKSVLKDQKNDTVDPVSY